MFTAITQQPPFTHLFSHAPQTFLPSHHANLVVPRHQLQIMEHDNKQAKATTSPPSRTLPRQSYAERYANQIRNPAAKLACQRGSREKRLGSFLNKVKHDRDEGRFEARSDQIQRTNYLAQLRRYQETLARSAPDFGPLMEEEEEEDVKVDDDGMVFDEGIQGIGVGARWKKDRGVGFEDERILEEFISEEQDYQAFLEELERSGDIEQQSQPVPASSQYDDEEDYEHIFAELLDDDHDHHTASPDHTDDMNDGMDTS
ncbi:conserved hypothetical protein [Histoplasma capsulatum var. duboisii H88]|uniref:Uncharacterized protein n=1 Tax=Ajellomyces capsulatus (strain H88) TaxID=544711 RepID=F0UDB2_AJEC8|nr:conserved hypothetical protein [Histoplasma capsulatum var. duboisii H88]QSS49672.1 hypothetical protein I7I53_10090 [Histoplasma capsulatum var. duboisii H88]